MVAGADTPERSTGGSSVYRHEQVREASPNEGVAHCDLDRIIEHLAPFHGQPAGVINEIV